MKKAAFIVLIIALQYMDVISAATRSRCPISDVLLYKYCPQRAYDGECSLVNYMQ